MLFTTIVAGLIAAVSAGHLAGPLAVGHGYYGPLHLPVINAEGVPVDTAAVQHARAAHLSQKVVVAARYGGDYGHDGDVLGAGHGGGLLLGAGHAGGLLLGSGHGNGLLVGIGGHGGPIGYAGPAAYPTTAVLPAVAHGVPLNTPEVSAAIANHVSAHHEALGRLAHVGVAHGYLHRKRRGILGAYNGALLGLHGGSLGLHAGALGLHGGVLGVHGAVVAAPAYHGPIHLPIINAEGVPVDTADVQHSRAAHLSQRATVIARNGDYGHGGYYGEHGWAGWH